MNLSALNKALHEKNEPEISLCSYCSEPSHEGNCITPTSEGINFYFAVGKYFIEETEQQIERRETQCNKSLQQ